MKKAMIMCAGVGSRLDPLTKTIPKPLIPIANVPVMDFLISRLQKFGVNQVVANTYYLAEKVESRYGSPNFANGVAFEFVREAELSGTAGGVKKCQYFFDESDVFLVMSADGFHNVELDEVYNSHKQSGAIATMVLKEVPKDETFMYGVVVQDDQGFVSEFQEKPSPEEAKSNFINTGIYVFDYRIFDYIPKDTFCDFAKNVFPILLNSDEKINTVKTDCYWNDIGTVEQYIQSTKDVLSRVIEIPNTFTLNTNDYRLIRGQNVTIEDGVQISGDCTIGSNCVIKKGTKLRNSIIFDDVVISENTVVEDSVIANGVKLTTSIKNTIVTKDAKLILAN